MIEPWTFKDTVNLIHEVIVGILTGIVAAVAYEQIVNIRKKRVQYKKYGFLASSKNKFDWQDWKIDGGQINSTPIDSWMKLKYEGDKSFSYEYRNADTKESGTGYIFFDEVFLGRLSFWVDQKSWFNYRNVYYKEIIHDGEKYDAIYVNADDQKTKYVMLRPTKHRRKSKK
jgi:hypothetical protein